MKPFELTPEEKEALEARHKASRDGKERDRIKAVLLHVEGWDNKQIAQALRLHRTVIRQHLLDYRNLQKLKINSGGARRNYLDDEQTQALIAHLEANLYTSNAQIAAYIERAYKVTFTVSGLHKWLHKHGFRYKKPKGAPYKANQQAQSDFIAGYKELKEGLEEDEHIVFMDAVHPTQSTKLSYGWIRKGKEKAIATNGSRTRMNIVGGIELGQLSKAIIREYETVNGDSLCDYLRALRQAYGDKRLHVVLDGAGYHKSAVFKALAEELNITLHTLPPYSPNLNPIERLWKVMNREVRNNRFFSSAKEFKARIREFFDIRLPDIAKTLDSWINDNFQLLGSAA